MFSLEHRLQVDPSFELQEEARKVLVTEPGAKPECYSVYSYFQVLPNFYANKVIHQKKLVVQNKNT